MKKRVYRDLPNWGILIVLISLLAGCTEKHGTSEPDGLYEGFKNPTSESRPFVRWWWNGNKVEAQEINRELELLKNAGFGGVEINPIAFPEHSREIGVESKVWMSEEWIELLVHACKKAGELDMIADLIVGSGWPFGGEFLEDDEIIQMVIPHHILIEKSSHLSETAESLIERLKHDLSTGTNHFAFNEKYPPRVLYVSILSQPVEKMEQMVDLMVEMNQHGIVDVTLDPDKSYILSFGVIQKGHRTVMHGSPGAAGPVMDHYKKEVTLAYLSRLKSISEQTGIPLSDLIRALFCDSIELAGSNWSDGFSELFKEKYGYKLEPYMPFVFSTESEAQGFIQPSIEMNDRIKRARFDFNRMLVDVFLENFTTVFQEFCTSEGLKCRYQAYGVPFLMGMLEGFMIPDIPESNNWIYSSDMDASSFEWDQYHGYMIWNMYAAAGGHLMGKKIISCEAMTNTRGVFKTSLEEIKQHDDMNFITGINHSVLHGFNYSPPEAGFPGWVRYGAYFNEQNPWWPFLHHWVDYNARLSYVFQNSQAKKSIAILGPTSDLWSEEGLIRQPFHVEPWYLHLMWQPISQAGYSAEYLNERVLQNSSMDEGRIDYGTMSYKALILANVRSLASETAKAIQKYVENGGSLLMVDQRPERSANMEDANKNDVLVKELFQELMAEYPDQVILAESPENHSLLNEWTYGLLAKLPIEPDVEIAIPDPDVYQIYQTAQDKDIFFFTNVHRNDSAEILATFRSAYGIPSVWDPETGERWRYPMAGHEGNLHIDLPPLKSLLLVFEKVASDAPEFPQEDKLTAIVELDQLWTVKADHINGNHFQWEFPELTDLSKSTDPEQNSFAGSLIYSTVFSNPGNITHLDLGETGRGITQVLVNGEDAGINWYGDALFHIEPYLTEGPNKLEIIYTTVLANYCIDLDDPVAKRWTAYRTKVPNGLEGPVSLMN